MIELGELRARDIHGPDGAPSVIEDGVMLVRRREAERGSRSAQHAEADAAAAAARVSHAGAAP